MASKRWLFVWEVACLARLFRDLKVNEQDGKVYLTLYNRDGSAALRDVSVGVSSEVVQPGDHWTAAAANLLLRLDEEGQPQLALTPEDIGAAAAGDGVNLYTHQKSGTVHALAGSGGNIRFVAAADYTAGDTFTVNGAPCTAATAGGDALWTGFFKTGAVVVCWKNGDCLTFNGGGLPAAEAAKLAPENIKSGVSITANGKTVTGTFTADATAAAGQILSGKTAYVKGSKVTGTIPSKAAAGYRPGTKAQTIAAGQYLSGAQTIEGDANLIPANIRRGVSIFGVAGGYNPGACHAATQAHFYGRMDDTVEVNAPNGTCKVAAVMAGNQYYATARITLWGWNGSSWAEIAKSEDYTGTEGKDTNAQLVGTYSGYSRYRLNVFCDGDQRTIGLGSLQGY